MICKEKLKAQSSKVKGERKRKKGAGVGHASLLATFNLPKRVIETIMVAIRLEVDMPTTLTLKNIPDAVYDRLKHSAKAHRRSMNSEAIVCLEEVLLPGKVTPAERLARARELRASLPKGKFQAHDIDELKREGRP
jgi:plasmid stability protein